MRHVTERPVALAGALLVVLIVFVAYRARTFTYCAGYEARNSRFSIVGANQVCGAGEEPEAFPALWRREGLAAKFKTIGQTAVHAFVP